MQRTDFRQLSEELRNLLNQEDALGSITNQKGRFSALLVTDPYSREKLEEKANMLLQDKGARISLIVEDAVEDNIKLALQEAWTNGALYILFE